jgi:hypothetical protein
MIVFFVSASGLLVGNLGRSTAAAKDLGTPADALNVSNQRPKDNPSGEALLAEMAADHGYRLEPGQMLRRVPRPFPDIRAAYYKEGNPGQAKSIPTPADAISFIWDGEKLTRWGMKFGAGYTLSDVVDNALKIKPPDFEGPKEILNLRLEGDWVIRKNASEEESIMQLGTILQKEYGIPMRLVFVKKVRGIYVARGKYHFSPVQREEKEDEKNEKGSAKNGRIEIYGSELSNPRFGGGGSGEFKEFLAWLGRWIDASIIDEVSEPPVERVIWHDNHSEKEKGGSSDDHDPEQVLKNIAAQTGLTFTKELRVVRRLVLEPLE